MELNDYLTIAAIIFGPLLAVQVTRKLDIEKQKRERKLELFKTLMETRAYRYSNEHVLALNRIDLEFDRNDKKEKIVIEKWKEYLDSLGPHNLNENQVYNLRLDRFVDLLHAMAQVLSYDFDKTHIKNSSYAPVFHGNIMDDQDKIRRGLIDILNGEKSIPIVLNTNQDQ